MSFLTLCHLPAPRQPRLSHPDERPQPAMAPHQVWCVDVYCGHRCAACDDTAGRRCDRGAAEPRGMPRPPMHAGALSHGHARHRPPAAVTASRHVSNISVTVGPLSPANCPLIARRGTGCPRGTCWYAACCEYGGEGEHTYAYRLSCDNTCESLRYNGIRSHLCGNVFCGYWDHQS